DTPTDGGVITNDIPPGTFSISEATDNVKASIVKKSETIGTIKIGFVSANSYAYTMDYTVEDSEADESKKITKDDFTKSDNVLTFNNTGLTKVRNSWEASTDSKENTITINFTFTADNKTLNNNTQTLSVKVTLTKAPKIDATNIETILNRINGNGNGIGWGTTDDYVRFTSGKYENNVYTLTSTIVGTYDAPNTVKVSEVKDKFVRRQNGNYYNGNSANPYFTVEDDGTAATKTGEEVSFSVNLKFTDLAESDMTTLTVKLVKATGDSWTWEE
ncbi:hypothetical protein, partial [Brachyspira catarrhinii]|uniref:hypothetical protein n=1 Tax=Brachyspira catarrhinii TaxID=2528966 RepID=UPI001386C284